ncbi:insulinase family protein [Altererythrobacter arenosus]|uniref:Insulinase family protein n=1 Tax=Altererythrobacter arenosus TaxID=3032592 RepID=A0ABY8FSQ0_9SPHN|nr:M16 family metallopeptidase [Altererythrobacter sp. CAU 1644]WFL77867.1 insulinase family protein [Altererythrobacter sp. CAU 1644]
MMMKSRLTLSFAALLLCSSALTAEDSPPAAAGWNAADWGVEGSDIPVDTEFRFGRLDNGVRYILRQNATPEGTALVRLHIGSGSLDETDSERGLAHFLEHMAFNGSKRVPEGEMVKLLEREGLSFGADTNATTSLETTTYMLNLPRNDEALLDTALMLMRETASELLIEQEAVERERGVILSERRDRNNYAYKQTIDELTFASPAARFIDRLPIGAIEVLESATAADLRGYYERTYVPENTVVVVVGDFPIATMEQLVHRHFAEWRGGPDPVEPETGPVDLTRRSETDIYVDPALSERVVVSSFGAWEDRPDSFAKRREDVLRQIGYAIVNRRLATLARGENAPFRSAGFGTGDIFEDGRMTRLVVDTADGEWRKGLAAATAELRRALAHGFSEAEVAEQLARLRSSLENATRSSETRTNSALVQSALALVEQQSVPSTPESALERFESYADAITPELTLAALLAEAAPLEDPMIRFQGRTEPAGGESALRSAWNELVALPILPPQTSEAAEFAYTDFGEPGTVVSDTRDERLGLRLIRFANGVMLNLKQTDIRKDQISFRLSLDGGNLLNTREDPLKTALVSSLPAGGLGKHSQDELETVLAGRTVRFSLSSTSDAFRFSGGTRPKDLELQMQLLAAAITDPGYRGEAIERYRRSLDEFFARLDATPGSAVSNSLGGILSDNDPRFTLQSREAFETLDFAKLRSDIADRLSHGAIELALVGDFDEDAAIAAVAQTLGALPPRETDFLPREEARQRVFTSQRISHRIMHRGEPDQALVRMTWPTTDDSDLGETLRLELLERVIRIALQDKLREELGKTYSPSASSSPTRTYPGYGTFSITASVDVSEVEATRAAIADLLSEFAERPLDVDLLDRAREPMLENYANMLKSLGGWMSLTDNAQSQSERLDRYFAAPAIIRAVTPEDIRQVARKYLAPGDAVEVIALPQTETGPAAAAADPVE